MKTAKQLYKTAQSLVNCAAFKTGDCVSVEYYWTDQKGVDWYVCNGKVTLPATQLTRFVL